MERAHEPLHKDKDNRHGYKFYFNHYFLWSFKYGDG